MFAFIPLGVTELFISVELGTTSKIRVVLSTGRNDIATATVKLGAPSGVSFRYEETELMDDGMRHNFFSDNYAG